MNENGDYERIIRKRKRKSQDQLKTLMREFDKNANWSKETLLEVSKKTGLSEAQVYKWGWDQKRKKYGPEVALQMSGMAPMSPLGSNFNEETYEQDYQKFVMTHPAMQMQKPEPASFPPAIESFQKRLEQASLPTEDKPSSSKKIEPKAHKKEEKKEEAKPTPKQDTRKKLPVKLAEPPKVENRREVKITRKEKARQLESNKENVVPVTVCNDKKTGKSSAAKVAVGNESIKKAVVDVRKNRGLRALRKHGLSNR